MDHPANPHPHGESGVDTAPAAPPRGQNHALLLGYDGSRFLGWQVQQQGETVQGRLEAGLETILRRQVKVFGSGRTDAGVHALNQVANVFLPPGQDLRRLRASLNGLAGPAISVKAIVPVSASFHARHRAKGKHYQYRIFNRPYPPVFGRERCWWLKAPLQMDAMREAAAHLLGTHDFTAFRASHCGAPHPVRTLRRLEIAACEDPGCTLTLDLEADAFLQHMARIITGTLVAVGQGKLEPERLAAILAGQRREEAHATAPPVGLHLMGVRYDLEEYPELREFGIG